MANFKGTKGKWKLANNDLGYYTSVRNSDNSRKICVSRINDFTYNNANMLLISKAPEMLEKLIAVRKWYEENQYRLGEYTPVIFSQIQSLIIEATEIK